MALNGVQETLRLVGHGGGMVSGKVSEKVTFGRVSLAGISWAAWVAGIGMGITIAMQVSTLHMHDINTVYGAVLSLSRLAALVGTYLSVIGIFLIARIPVVEKSIGHDQLVIWHRILKLIQQRPHRRHSDTPANEYYTLTVSLPRSKGTIRSFD